LKTKLIFVIVLLSLTVVYSVGAQYVKGGFGADVAYYNPYDNNPPGAPPNYNLVDSSYFQGVPSLPEPLTNNAGGYYIYNDTAAGKWYISNFLYSRGNSLEQFHGSILVIMEQPPAPNVNIWSKGFELTCSLKQNDRWGWVKWPDSIAPNLYEIWWDITIDYAKPHDTGDFRDTLGINVAGCAIDFNLWSSGHGSLFGPDQIYLGKDMIKLSDVPGFEDTYPGVTDQYQLNDPEECSNTSRFTPKNLPGATYNKNGLISSGTYYSNRYGGSWAYEGNGVQFSTLFCPPSYPPRFVRCEDEDEDNNNDADDEADDHGDDSTNHDDEDANNCDYTYLICPGGSVYDTIKATDPNEGDILTISILSGPGNLVTTPSVTPAFAYYTLSPTSSGLYTVTYEVTDGTGGNDTMTITYDVTVSSPPEVVLPIDTNIFLCAPNNICLPVDILDNDCDVSSITTNYGTYTGTLSDFDQLHRVNQLGGTITQVGGGDPGKVLLTASDFVPPVNSQSGVSVTLPNFVFADHIVDYGSFPNGLEPGNSADFLLGPPTDMTFTTAGPGGPDGGDGDGSIAFGSGYHCIIGFAQYLTTCNGANTDFMIFTNTNGSGTAEIKFKKDGTTQYTLTKQILGGTASSGMGGVTLDLPDGIEFNEVQITNVSGTFEIDAFAARTAPSSSTSDICFYADTSGAYDIEVQVTDACGNIGTATSLVTVNLNQPPVANAGADVNTFLCSLAPICFGVSFSDPDNNLALTELSSGPGTLNGNQICFTPPSAGAFTFVIHAVDSCGLEDFDTVVVNVSTNLTPIADDPSPVTKFLCQPTQLCHTFTASDPNGNNLSWSLLSGQGTITPDGNYCFTPTVSGVYNATVIVADSCGAADTTTLTYNVTINSSPVAVDPSSPVPLFLCNAEQVCYQFSAIDDNGDNLVWQKISGDGDVSIDGNYCLTPSSSGAYSVTAMVSDSCGAADTVSLSYNITINDAPQIAFGNDTTISLCNSEELCFNYTVSDTQGLNGLTEAMVSGFGSLDTVANRVCFTPTGDGDYEFIVSVSDSCGATDLDTINVNVNFGEIAAINCPGDTIDINLCAPDTICQMLDITPTTVTVTTSLGSYNNGQLCFYADTSGIYTSQVVATSGCGADTCQVVFNVNIGAVAQITCPDPANIFMCQADTVCLPVSINGSGVNVSVSPIGSYSAGNICFAADTSGHYELKVVASTNCGSDSCMVVADVEINSPPVAVNPPASIDSFVCSATQVCYQFSSSDINGGSLVWSRLSGIGTVNAAGLWCFDATGNGSYAVTAMVVDSCGAADTVNMTYNITVDNAPEIAFGNDTTIFLCNIDSVCIPYTLSDADNNIESVELIAGNGFIDTLTSQLCFMPTSVGDYRFIIKAVDSCQLDDVDTINVTIGFNNAPIVDAGNNQNIFQCTPTEICWPVSVSDPDGNLDTVELMGSPGTFDGSNICFTPDKSWCYEFILKATDKCGEVTQDTVAVCVTINSPPVADAGEDQTLSLCTPQEICLPVSCSDTDANLSNCALVEGPGNYNGNNICFTPTASGTYSFVMEATDACGLSDRDTVNVNVTLNSAPVCHVPQDTVIFQCAPAEVCLPAFAEDSDNNLSFTQVDVGTIVGNTWCYTPNASQAVTVTMHSEDSCGAVCESQFNVEFIINKPPEIAFGNDTTLFLCASQEVCLPYYVTDPDAPRPVNITLEAGPGTIDEANSEVCFTPATDGDYTFIIKIEDECGVFDVDTINVNVQINKPPVANVGADQTLTLCDSTSTICWPASCSDVDGNLSDCMFTGTGTYDGSSVCFNPTVSGLYQFTLRAIDDCGEEMTDTVNINVTVNTPPQIAMGNDTSFSLCSSQEVCLPYTVSDNDGLGGLVETMFPGNGTIDTAANTVCFTPTIAGNYEFIVKATDSCGAMDVDTIDVNVSFGETANINNCPSGPVDVSLCQTGSACYMLDISPASANVVVSNGNYNSGELCFNADTSGTYIDTVIATVPCGADTCVLTFNVNIGSSAQITCPDPQQLFLCQAQTACIPISVMGQGVNINVTPIGSYNAGSVCFPADTSGHYVLKVVATTDCGADSCNIVADVVIDSPPVANQPSSPVDTFVCASGVICYQFTASDVNGGALNWTKLSGDGSVTPDGLWCFEVQTSGVFTVETAVFDSCGMADTVSLIYNVTIDNRPQISLGIDQTKSLCSSQSLCLPYTVTDIDSNIVLEKLLGGAGSLDTALNQLCFMPDTPGVYRFIASVSDSCSETDVDTLRVTVNINHPPVANAGFDQTLFLCQATEVCWDAGSNDVDGNLDSSYVVSSVGAFDGNQICFTPDTVGHYSFIFRAVDACGASDQDTVNIDITFNTAPACSVPDDTTIFQCAPTEVNLPIGATDVDGNFDHCEIISGPGSIVGGNWVYTPTTDDTVKVKVMCLDACGASCIDSFTVNFEINTPPVVDAGEDFTEFLCQPQSICFPVAVTDKDANLKNIELVSSNGYFDEANMQICFDVPAGERTYQFVLKATDSCDAMSYDTVKVTVDYNAPPQLDMPPDFVAYLDQPGEFCFDVNASDADGNLASVTSTAPGTYNEATGQVCFNADTTGQYCMTVTATDSCGQEQTRTICIQIEIDECIHVQIENSPNVFQGQNKYVDVFLNGAGKELGGYDLLIAYDQSAMSVTDVLPGSLFENCKWEYFTYRFDANGNCSSCPSGLLRIVALAETNNGAYHPDCYMKNLYGSLAKINFYISNNRTLECQYVPVKFFWLDCGDNSFASRDGDTLWISREVYSVEGNVMTNNNYDFPTYFGANNSCLVGGGPGKPAAIRCVDYTNGGIDIICADSIDAGGDINLNGIPNEISDAVLFSQYFIYGLSVFNINVQGQIAASDVNGDGITLSVADLVYLIDAVSGDNVAGAKPNPSHQPQAELTVTDGVLSITKTDMPVGAIALLLEGKTNPELDKNAADMDLRYNFDGTNTHVLIFSLHGKADLKTGKVLKFNNEHSIKSIEVGSYNGYMMNAKLNNIPKDFSLKQNYPNPFNPVTTIEFTLPVASEWNLVIYNILGQEVENWNKKSEAGYIKIEWDASKYASGVYFYRLMAGSFSDTKKMVLLK